MTSKQFPNSVNALGEHANNWVFADLRDRILGGDILFLDEAEEHLTEGLEDEDLLPDGFADHEAAGGFLAHEIWQYCEAVASAWAEDYTDADRVMEAFEDLSEQGIAVGLFIDASDLELSEADPGGIFLWVNEWENLDAEKVTELRINFMGLSLPAEAIGELLVTALKTTGLQPGQPEEGIVKVPVMWRWHVGDVADRD